ncbi:hypothetical protein [Phytomonospora endophytica]|uniref:Uncharacterized protein n=1 Tax=Phytomonospora endophytica TaxID=714109 RepID=A0A841G100_9ACTN|nr:hypothetical protein [Phytomonospora endophytica]MBB6039337.1 hypothetical protein [Phytomonospora endophytica]GIG69720.1 hypothetical protein Pen01_60150 [Phytomonospora endophytica]
MTGVHRAEVYGPLQGAAYALARLADERRGHDVTDSDRWAALLASLAALVADGAPLPAALVSLGDGTARVRLRTQSDLDAWSVLPQIGAPAAHTFHPDPGFRIAEVHMHGIRVTFSAWGKHAAVPKQSSRWRPWRRSRKDGS